MKYVKKLSNKFELVKRLREEMERRGISVVRLARLSGINDVFLYDILEGRRNTSLGRLRGLMEIVNSCGGDDDEDVSVKLRMARRRANLSQREVALMLGVSRTTVEGWETGRRRASILTRFALSFIYEVDLRELLNERERIEFLELIKRREKWRSG